MQKISSAYPPLFIYQRHSHDLARLSFCTKSRAASSVHTFLLHPIFLFLKYLYCTKIIVWQIIYT
ncbi:hypothetical protein PI172_1632 [Prevotella intermedia]|uniref:Uncharacterized protein n=1 Tax=Prevotella intermedia TaxID=28131 RepID=A0AAD1BL40_PREIN|nr:hypothetical protein [Prevotella intermedia]AFJ08784.1 hypothetical protein PIN17_A1048 [Prevotella intermedia 17]BAR96360.1 hypothetical protein PI172_1632 [Prevotella intermedia]